MAMVSIIIPAYRSANILGETLDQVMKSMEGRDYEVLVVNDGSPDDTWSVAKKYASEHAPIRAIDLLNNYGQHTAVLCGMANARGRYHVTMDDDLQNPPSELPKLIAKIEEGYDLVFAKFEKKKHASYRRLGSRLIGYLNKKIFNKPDDITLTNFRIFTSDVSKRSLAYKTNYPYIPGLLLMHSSRIANVLTEHHARKEGSSNYGIWQILKLMSRLLFNYSSYPLRVVSGLGIVISILSFVAGVVYVLKALITGVSVPGWTTLVVLLSFLSGFILVILGIMGEYLARIMKQIASDEPFQIREVIE